MECKLSPGSDHLSALFIQQSWRLCVLQDCISDQRLDSEMRWLHKRDAVMLAEEREREYSISTQKLYSRLLRIWHQSTPSRATRAWPMRWWGVLNPFVDSCWVIALNLVVLCRRGRIYVTEKRKRSDQQTDIVHCTTDITDYGRYACAVACAVHLTVNTDALTVARAVASPSSSLKVCNRTWLKITIPHAFIGQSPHIRVALGKCNK